jgi:hypothetical protein
MRGPCLYTQRGVARVLRAVKQSGVAARVEIGRDGVISIITNDHLPIEPVAAEAPSTSWDEALGGKRA